MKYKHYRATLVLISLLLLLSCSNASESLDTEEPQTPLSGSWQQAKENTAIYRRKSHVVVEFQNKLWMYGGQVKTYSSTINKNDILSSSDGINWTLEKESSDWDVDSYPQVIEYKGTLFAFTTNGNQIWSSSDGENWTLEDAPSNWSDRPNNHFINFKESLWLIEGNSDSGIVEIWTSSDGLNWTESISSSNIPHREYYRIVDYKEKLFIIAGESGGAKNDVWSSEDGVIWIEETSNAAFSKRRSSKFVVLDNTLFLLGGSSNAHLNDVWSSTDGVTWTEVTSATSFSSRYSHSVTVFQEKLWVIGGDRYPDGILYDMWSSEDGEAWTEHTSYNQWSPRSGHTLVEFKDTLYLLGGSDGTRKNDIWSTNNGNSWTRVTNSADWSGRIDHKSVALNDSLFLFGDGEIWSSDDAISWNSLSHNLYWDSDDISVIAHENKLWAFTSYSSSGSSKVSTSSNGQTWTTISDLENLDLGGTVEVAVSNNKFWLFSNQKLWSSSNGVDWDLVVDSFSFVVQYAQLLSYNNTLILVGMTSMGDTFFPVFYTSNNGKTWVDETGTISWSDRIRQEAIVYKDALWVVGGQKDSIPFNDVWYTNLTE